MKKRNLIVGGIGLCAGLLALITLRDLRPEVSKRLDKTLGSESELQMADEALAKANEVLKQLKLETSYVADPSDNQAVKESAALVEEWNKAHDLSLKAENELKKIDQDFLAFDKARINGSLNSEERAEKEQELYERQKEIVSQLARNLELTIQP